MLKTIAVDRGDVQPAYVNWVDARHRRLAMEAAEAGVSLNKLITSRI